MVAAYRLSYGATTRRTPADDPGRIGSSRVLVDPEQPDPLPDWAIVVRGGVATAKLLRAAFDKCFDKEGRHDASVNASAHLYAEEIALEARELHKYALPHRRMQTATVGRIRAIGADVVLSEPPPGHHAIRFSERPTDSQLDQLVAALRPACGRPNPVAK